MLKRLLALFAAVCIFQMVPSAAQALELRAVARSDFPVFVGGGIDAEGPLRLRASTSLGYLPKAYISATNGVLVPMFENQGYGQAQADLVEAAVRDSLVWRTSLGWRPFDKAGFVFGFGYTHAGLGGRATAVEIVEGATGTTLPDSARNGAEGLDFDLGANLHLLHLEVGWEWTIAKHLWVRTGLGWAFTVGGGSHVDAQFEPRRPAGRRALDQLENETESFLDGAFTSYVHPPHITLAVGWNFSL